MRLYDTAKQAVVDFEPAAGPGGTVTMYTCGITPYDSAHIGHAATYMAYDILQRRLRDLGYKVLLVRNVTDVDDDILRKARELDVHYLDLAAEEMARFSADMDALGLLPAASEPRATSAIPDILGFIGMVLANGHAYQAGGGVYFDVSSWPASAPSATTGGTDAGAGPGKRGQPGRPQQDRPAGFRPLAALGAGGAGVGLAVGEGRPGWHIECSALVVRELGITIDLHGGGSDLIFPHHECETAQSEAATGERFVRHWAHTGMVGYQGTKMSKSLGNLVFVRDLLKKWEPSAIRLAILAHHYRSDWTWEERLLEEASARLAVWRGSRRRAAPAPGAPFSGLLAPGALHVVAEVRAALDDDLDTPRALAAIDAAAAASFVGAGPIAAAAALLGVDV